MWSLQGAALQDFTQHCRCRMTERFSCCQRKISQAVIRCWRRGAFVCCVMKNDFDAYFEDTMRAGHYENRVESVEIMIHASRGIITHLLALGVRFEKMRTEALPTHGKGRTQNRGFVSTRISQGRKSRRHCCHMYRNLTM